MGYRHASPVYRLQFEPGGPFAGLEVDCRSGTGAQYKAVAELDDAGPPDEVYERLCRVLAASLVRWNVEDERTGEAVPATYDGLMSQDIELINVIAQAWLDAALARRQQQSATAEDREMAAALAEFGHDAAPGVLDGALAAGPSL